MGSAALRHVSVRVPWHDNGWNGRVCLDPKGNSACLAIRRNAANRDDEFEQANKEQCFSEFELERVPPCLAERGAFLASKPLLLRSILDYSKYSKHHEHILPVTIPIPAFGGTLTPFRWMLRDSAFEIAAERDIEASMAREPKEGEAPDLIVKTPWVQDADNQRALLDGFRSELSEEGSLVFFYAKQTPLSDNAGRQIVAVARMVSIGGLTEYPYKGGQAAGRIRSFAWERPFQHSLRPADDADGAWQGGVVLPYHEILRAAQEKGLDPSEFIAEVPGEITDQFLYASEHVTHGSAITALQSIRNAVEKAQTVLSGPWQHYLAWIDGELSNLWKMHGLAPGLGSALSCIGGKFNGTLFAHALAAEITDEEDPWPAIEAIFAGDREAPQGAPPIKTMQRRRFADLKDNDPATYELIKLLSRFELTRDQAKSVVEDTDDPSVFLKNPYRLYELTRKSTRPIGLMTIDRSLYPADPTRKRAPFPDSIEVDLDEPEDAFRLRAIIVDALEHASRQGHTLLSTDLLIDRLKHLPLTREVEIDEQVVRICKEDFQDEIQVFQADEQWLLQLNRYRDAGEVIREHVLGRVNRAGEAKINWNDEIAREFGPYNPADSDEKTAREEKDRALKTLERSPLSILTGPAGTGKTTLLKIFLDQSELVGRDVLLLAPTGKARVRLGNQTGRPEQAKTLAQFLLAQGRYNFETDEHLFDRRGATAAVSTCIVDECSMLTEDQLAALMSALPMSARLILVGDPQQLPPIGAGRPFVDVIQELRDNHGGLGLADLTVSRRQGQGGLPVPALSLPDVQLANLFSGRPLAPGEDEVVSTGETPPNSDRLRFVSWENPADLRAKLLEVLSTEVAEEEGAAELEQAIDLSLGAVPSGDYLYFNQGAGRHAERWQILSAHRNSTSGSAELNRFIKLLARNGRLAAAQNGRAKWRVVKPRGNDLVTYGDKVICLRNHKHQRYSREEGQRVGYLANGEVGVVIGDAGVGRKPYYTQVEFASQPGESFSFDDRHFAEEGSPYLELAYAVTVHKAQGSEFGAVILVLPANSSLLSREMLYTALTRQKDRVWILHEGPFNHFLRLGSDFFSETARRSTNLFGPPKMALLTEHGSGGRRSAWLSERLIHKTRRGDLVRSKSEVIIADILDEFERAGRLRYSYEKPFQATDGSYRLPDFTVETDEGTFLWEHCGMLGLPEYARRWSEKLTWYGQHGIRPWSAEEERGRLIVTEDSLGGGINSSAIHQLASLLFSTPK